MGGLSMLMLVCLFVGGLQGSRRSYEGYEVWEVHVNHVSQVQHLLQLDAAHQVQMLRLPQVGGRSRVLVSPDYRNATWEALQELGCKIQIHTENLQDSLTEEYSRLEARYTEDPYSFDLNDYNSYEAIMNQIDVWISQCPTGLECSSYSIGNSYYGRDMKVLRIKRADKSNKVLWFGSTVHAYEWLSVGTTQNIVDHLISKYGTDDDVDHMLDNYDVYFLLVGNPDGYVYTFSTDGDRLWRKNRRPLNGTSCVGTDLNRNFNDQWGKQGVDLDPCSYRYPGPSAASEVEIQNLQMEAQRLTQQHEVAAWFMVHCCGELWMFPLSHNKDFNETLPCVRSPDYADLLQVADGGAKAILEEGGRQWKTGTICEAIYAATGSEADYVYAKANVKYAWAIELRGTSEDVDKSQIGPSFREFWAGAVGSMYEMEKVEGW